MAVIRKGQVYTLTYGGFTLVRIHPVVRLSTPSKDPQNSHCVGVDIQKIPSGTVTVCKGTKIPIP